MTKKYKLKEKNFLHKTLQFQFKNKSLKPKKGKN